MKRNHKKLVEKYNKLAEASRWPSAWFYSNDFDSIREISKTEGGGEYLCINYALMSGFMIGYNFARKYGDSFEHTASGARRKK